MGFKLPKEYQEKLKQENELKYVILEDGSQKHLSEFEDKSITPDKYQTFRMNSYARNEIYPKLTNETLLEQAEYYISQCHKPYRISTYNDAAIHLILPELINRFKELNIIINNQVEHLIRNGKEIISLTEEHMDTLVYLSTFNDIESVHSTIKDIIETD